MSRIMVIRDPLDPDRIRENLKTKRIGSNILVYDRTSSTNDIAAKYVAGSASDGLVVFAEQQTAGRGRAGAKWQSSHGQSILCSIVIDGGGLSGEILSLTCAVAVADALGRVGSSQAKIKWPNDILLNGKKVAGILLESKANDPANRFVIGIGVNCHQQKDSFPPELQDSATSIDMESRTVCDRVTIARRLLTSIDHWLDVAQTNPAEVTARWRELNMQLGHRVALSCSGKRFTGNCIGIDPQNGLILQLDSGSIRIFPAAHTTIAKSTYR